MASFFDKVIVGINDGAKSISEGSKNMLEKAKLNTAIQNLETEKKKIAELLGAKAYEMHTSGVSLPQELLGFCMEMINRDEEIKKLQANLASLETKNTSSGSKVCSCGHVSNPGAAFCTKCGNKF